MLEALAEVEVLVLEVALGAGELRDVGVEALSSAALPGLPRPQAARIALTVELAFVVELGERSLDELWVLGGGEVEEGLGGGSAGDAVDKSRA